MPPAFRNGLPIEPRRVPRSSEPAAVRFIEALGHVQNLLVLERLLLVLVIEHFKACPVASAWAASHSQHTSKSTLLECRVEWSCVRRA